MFNRLRQWRTHYFTGHDRAPSMVNATRPSLSATPKAWPQHGGKEFIVIGMGRFGTSLAEALIAQGHSVLAVDNDYHRIQAISGDVPNIVHIDATSMDALREIGADHFDIGVVCIGTDFESNLLATVLLRKIGVRHVIAKARTRTQREILLQVGADEVILPEHEAGVRLARRLGSADLVDYLELDPDIGIIEMIAPEYMAGCALAETDLRKKHGLTVLAIWRDEELEVNPSADTCIQAGDKLLVFGKVSDARKWTA